MSKEHIIFTIDYNIQVLKLLKDQTKSGAVARSLLDKLELALLDIEEIKEFIQQQQQATNNKSNKRWWN